MNDQHRIVSSESEALILVDRDDNEIGFVSKADAHDGDGGADLRHMYFSQKHNGIPVFGGMTIEILTMLVVPVLYSSLKEMKATAKDGKIAS